MPFSGIDPDDWQWLKQKCAECADATQSGSEAIMAAARSERPDLLPMLETMLADYRRHAECRHLLGPGSIETEPPRPDFEPGEIVSDRYLVRSYVGRGGMGEVYEVVDRNAPERGSIALKTLRTDRVGNRDAAARFEREVRNSLAIVHPNVCRMYGTGRHNKPDAPVDYLMMEFLAGVTLAQWMKNRDVSAHPLHEAEALPLIRQMAAGLAAIHAAGVIHRDFKPANVMLVEREGGSRPVITDFGLSCRIGESTGAADVIGTPEWMAPEQFAGGAAPAGAIDVYALGVTMHEMLTGFRDVPRPAAELRSTGGKLHEVIHDCLERDPAKRLSDGAAVLRALNR